jgi:tetratricopeptide (TPR) repeat protein
VLRTPTGELIFRDLTGPRRPPRLAGWSGLTSVSISPDGRWAAAGTGNGYACTVWDARTGRFIQDLPARNARTAFSPEGRWLVVGTFEKYELHALDGDRWKSIRSWPRARGVFGAGLVAFTGDARMMALTDSVRSIRLLDTGQWQELATIAAPDSEELTWLCFSHEGRRLAAGTRDGSIQLWDLDRIRAQLRAMGLDWDLPAPPSRSDDGVPPARVEVDLGEVPQPERDSLILAVCPFDAEAYYRRGLAHAKRGRPREALDDLRRAIALRPDHAEAHHQRGWILTRQRDFPEAIAAFSRAIALKPDHAEAHAARGRACYALGQREQAARDFARAVELRPDWPEFANTAAWLLATQEDPRHRDPGRAVLLADLAIRLDRDEPSYWNTLGVAHYRAGHWGEAIAALTRSMELFGGQAEGYNTLFLAMAHAQLGHAEEARRWYDRAVRWMEEHPWVDGGEPRRFRAEAAELLRVDHRDRPGREPGAR